jgi:hypothetical protein
MTMNRFEDRLLAQLQDVVAARPAPGVVAPRRPRRARLALAGAGLATATAVFAIVATSGDVTPSAYAVEPRGDGSVSVEISSLRDAAGLQRALRAAGVPAVVDYGAGCTTPGDAAGASTTTRRDDAGGKGLDSSGPAPGPGATTGSVRISDDGVAFEIDPGTLKPGEQVFITTSTGEMSSVAMAIGKDKPALPCPR